jgi:hypothetical protein
MNQKMKCCGKVAVLGHLPFFGITRIVSKYFAQDREEAENEKPNIISALQIIFL